MYYLLELGPNNSFNKALSKFHACRCLVLGAGSEVPLVERFSKDIIGVNISRKELLQIKRSKTSLILGDAQQLPLIQLFFDLVVCKSTLHHLTNLNAAVLELSRVLRKGGHVILYEPGLLNPISLLGRKSFPTDIHVTYEKPFIPSGLKRLTKLHFRFVNESYFFLFVHIFPILGKWMNFFRDTRVLKAFYDFDALLCRTPFRNLCWILVFVLEKDDQS